MNEDIIRAAGTAIHDLMAQLEATRLERDQYKRERDEAREAARNLAKFQHEAIQAEARRRWPWLESSEEGK